jgi:lipoate-protein ligase A
MLRDTEVWRLIQSPPAPGADNMALDQALLESVADGRSPPVLRLYAWDPPCLSLGFAQSISDVDPARLEARGWDVVRRPTGGRAILHTDELTYAIVAPESHPVMHGGVLESYRRLSEGIVAALHRLGLEPEIQARRSIPDAEGGRPVCFEVPSSYEITWMGRKLVGSAQMRRRQCVLQHGTLPLFGDLGRICDGLAFDSEAKRETARSQVRDRAATLEQVCSSRTTWDAAAEALKAGMAETLGVAYRPDQPDEAERRLAHAYVDSTYAAKAWTCRI